VQVGGIELAGALEGIPIKDRHRAGAVVQQLVALQFADRAADMNIREPERIRNVGLSDRQVEARALLKRSARIRTMISHSMWAMRT